MEHINQMLEVLSQAPESQLDSNISKRLKGIIGKPLNEMKIEVMHCIDDCVRGSLASGFAMDALNILFEVHLEGKDEDWNDVNCPWRVN